MLDQTMGQDKSSRATEAPADGNQILANNTPLVVDLDGTLVQTDMLYESYFVSITEGLKHHLSAFGALRRGRASLKAYLAGAGELDYGLLPYNQRVLDLIHAAKSEGRRVYLATASDKRHADGVAKYLGLFDGIFSSDGVTNLSGEVKARLLIKTFGDRGFDYVANNNVDLAVWSHARTAYVVSDSAPLAHKVKSLGIAIERVDASRPSPRIWLKALRVHQYAKNGLIFVPLLTAHAYEVPLLLNAFLAFIAFSLCASSVYLLNDLVDLNADRRHPTKQKRPFAHGAIPLVQGVIAIPILLVLAFSCALGTSLLFTAVLIVYLALTLAYSLTLKRRLMVDIVVLSMLYTIRVIAGAAALPVVPSEWLLAFSMFVFTCLALVKRYVELALRIDKELPDPSNRNYRLIDLPIIGALAAASGFNAVTIFALYVSSPAVNGLYRHPELLWLICPILLYWIGRMVVLAHRRVVDDDPIVFALRDRNSYICAASMIIIILLAS
jgi:4-hydroxybenzoate polyprenyltransferase/beta-phosphoglucomutase-like phosphatase (HAD superfamily)